MELMELNNKKPRKLLTLRSNQVVFFGRVKSYYWGSHLQKRSFYKEI
jgi:hypothetical protein